MHKLLKKQSGFTLVEISISIAVFVLLIGIIVNIFISALKTQRSVVDIMAANDNANLALEQMAREIRTGTNFYLVPDSAVDVCIAPPINQIVTSGQELVFCNATRVETRYRIASGVIERKDWNAADFEPITSNKVKVTNLNFQLVNLVFTSGNWPPRVTIVMSVTPKQSNQEDVYITNLQTTVSGRDI